MDIDVSFRNLRFNLSYTLSKKEEYKIELTSYNEKDYGFFLVRIATECMLLLDQCVEIVWKKIGDLEKNSYKKFPVVKDANAFETRIRNIGLENIQEDAPELFEIIRNVQPFVCGESWLFYQHHIAEHRHSNPQIVYEYKQKNVIYIHALGYQGKEIKGYATINGEKHHTHIRKYGVPDQKPPKAKIKSEEEAINFIETCISETNKTIYEIIYYFESKL